MEVAVNAGLLEVLVENHVLCTYSYK